VVGEPQPGLARNADRAKVGIHHPDLNRLAAHVADLAGLLRDHHWVGCRFSAIQSDSSGLKPSMGRLAARRLALDSCERRPNFLGGFGS